MTVGADFVTYSLPRSECPVQWFKVCDSTVQISCPEDFYDKGDTIPAGRLWGNAVNLSVDSSEIFPLTRKCEIASR